MALLAATACAPPEVPTLKVGHGGYGSSVPLWVAQDQGMFSDEGITVELEQIPSSARVIEALAGGSIGIGQVSVLPALLARQEGLDLLIVAAGAYEAGDTPLGAIVAATGSSIAAPADLRGRKIGVVALRNTNQMMASGWLAEGGVKPDEVTWVEVPGAELGAAVAHGQVDAAVLFEPYVTAERDAGRVQVVVARHTGPPGAPTACYVTTRDWLAGHHAEVQAFRSALARAAEWCQREIPQVRQILVARTRLAPELADRIPLVRFATAIGPADVTPIENLARESGVLQPGDPIVPSMFDHVASGEDQP